MDIKKLLERVKCGFPVSEGIGRLQVGWVLLLSGDLKQKFCSFNKGEDSPKFRSCADNKEQ